MFGRRQRGVTDHTASRTIRCTVPFDLSIPLRNKAIIEILDLENVRRVEATIRGGYYGLWIDFYRFYDVASKRADLARIQEIMTELQRNYQAPSTAQ